MKPLNGENLAAVATPQSANHIAALGCGSKLTHDLVRSSKFARERREAQQVMSFEHNIFRPTKTKKHRQSDRQTDRDIQPDRETDRDRQSRETDRDRQSDRETDRDRQSDRETDNPTANNQQSIKQINTGKQATKQTSR